MRTKTISEGADRTARPLMAVDVKTAVQKAMAFLKEIMTDGRANNSLLEEIELSDDGKAWLITLSVPSSRSSFANVVTGVGEERDYKVLQVDSRTGDVLSLKIRKV